MVCLEKILFKHFYIIKKKGFKMGTQSKVAKDIINGYSKMELVVALFFYGSSIF